MAINPELLVNHYHDLTVIILSLNVMSKICKYFNTVSLSSDFRLTDVSFFKGVKSFQKIDNEKKKKINLKSHDELIILDIKYNKCTF